MKLGAGIDTGGTYTDAVIYDFESRKVLAKSKALTTRENLEHGILNAIDLLPHELLSKTELISLSTTLATNACVEDRTGRSRLIFFNRDEKVLKQHGDQYGLPDAEEILYEHCRTTFSGHIEQEPDWDKYLEDIKNGFEGLSGVGIVELNAMNNGAVIEKRAKKLLQSVHNVRVVCGHELFSELNVLQRGSGTLLNAGLFPVIEEFLSAIRSALEKRGIHASIVIVRSDGSLMTDAFASEHPVETLLCGPAASVLGSCALSGEKNCIVVDIGGTTTDIAIVKDGTPVSVPDGVTIGKWRTYVDGIYVKTIGLGGDSAVRYREGKLILEPYRVMPLCVAASRYPVITDNLRKLLKTCEGHTRYLHEHYILIKPIEDNLYYTPEEHALCRALESGPLSLADAASAAGKDVYTHDASRLIHDGIIQRCGLTPTDIMHILGDFTGYSAEAARCAAEFVSRNLELTVEELCRRVYREIERKIYLNVVEALLENQYPDYRKNGIGPELRAFLERNYDLGNFEENRPFISTLFRTEHKLIGVGAPTHIFLDNVAKRLYTQAIIPEHSEVANALGAIVGKTEAVTRVEINQNNAVSGAYVVHGPRENMEFEDLDEAVEYAKQEAKNSAIDKARRRGAVGELTVTCEVSHQNAQAGATLVYLGTAVTARAAGSLSPVKMSPA